MSLSSKRKKREEKQTENKGDGDRLSKTINILWEFQKKNEEESLFEEITPQNFPKWRKDIWWVECVFTLNESQHSRKIKVEKLQFNW